MQSRKSGAATAVALLGVLALGACAGTGGPATISGAVAPVPAGKETLSFAAPGLPQASAVRARYQDNEQREEYVLYRGDGGAQAEVILVESAPFGYVAQGGDNHVLEFAKITRDTVGMWNMAKAGNLSFSDSYPYQGKVPYYLLPFQRAATGQSCFGFHAEFDQDAFDPVGTGFDRQLFGYYCAPKGMTLDAAGIQSAIDGLDIKGVTKANVAGVPLQDFHQLAHDAQLAEAVKRGAPAGDTGNADFPLNLDRHYGDSAGSDAHD